MTSSAAILVISVAIAVFTRPLPMVAQSTGRRTLSRFGVCQREREKSAGAKPVSIGKAVRTPRKIRDVRPRYPKLPPGTSGSGIWAGELLLDTHGKVSRLWTVREVRFTPPFPKFNDAIVEALRQWEFEPLVVDSRPVPVCMTVTINIDWE